MGEENRHHVRWKDKIQIAYCPEHGSHSFREVSTEDVSEAGVLITVFEEINPEERIQLRLELVNDSVPIVAMAKVAHIEIIESGYRIGLEFVDIDDFQRQRLVRYLEIIKEKHKMGTE